MRPPIIIQFSPIRSGSTLVYNLIRESVTPRVIKTHAYMQQDEWLRVTTIRHPFDSIASIMKQQPNTPFENAIVEYCLQGGKDIAEHDIRTDGNTIVLRYEEFVNNFDVIFDALEQHGYPIGADVRSALKEKYAIEAVSARLQQGEGEEDSFLEQHISDTLGASTYKEFFTETQLRHLESNETLAKIRQLYYEDKPSQTILEN